MKKTTTIQHNRRVLRSTTWGLTAAGLLASTVLPLTGMLAAPAQASGGRVALSTCSELQTECTSVVLRIVDTTSVYGQTPTFKVEVVSTDAYDWDPRPAALSGVKVEGVPTGADAGAYQLRLVDTGLPDDLAVTYLPGVHTVSKANLTIHASGSFTYGTTPQPKFIGLVNGDTPADIQGVHLLGLPEHAPVGTYPARVSVDGANPNYQINELSGLIEVTKAPLTIDPTNRIQYGDPTVGFKGTIKGLVPWDTASQVVKGLAVSGGAPSGAGVGRYPVMVSSYFMVSNNYDVRVRDGFQIVEPREVRIKADDKTWVQGAPPPTYTATYTGLAASQRPGDIRGVTFRTTRGDFKLGTSPIDVRVDQSLNPNFRLRLENGTLTVTSR